MKRRSIAAVGGTVDGPGSFLLALSESGRNLSKCHTYMLIRIMINYSSRRNKKETEKAKNYYIDREIELL
jgi:hypothetical protein